MTRTPMWLIAAVTFALGLSVGASLRVSAVEEQVGRLERRAARQTLVVKHYRDTIDRLHADCVDAGVCEEDG